MLRHSAVLAAVAASLLTPVVWAEQRDERAGNCNDAKKQMEYFCNRDDSANDTMVALGTACTNAKKNVAAACEGVIEEDKAYKFDNK